MLGIVCEVFLDIDIDNQEWFELISTEYMALCYNSFGYSILADLIVDVVDILQSAFVQSVRMWLCQLYKLNAVIKNYVC